LTRRLDLSPTTSDAFDYTGSDFAQWCKEVGFRKVEVLRLVGSSSAGIAYK
jgi:hypothetical protein